MTVIGEFERVTSANLQFLADESITSLRPLINDSNLHDELRLDCLAAEVRFAQIARDENGLMQLCDQLSNRLSQHVLDARVDETFDREVALLVFDAIGALRALSSHLSLSAFTRTTLAAVARD